MPTVPYNVTYTTNRGPYVATYNSLSGTRTYNAPFTPNSMLRRFAKNHRLGGTYDQGATTSFSYANLGAATSTLENQSKIKAYAKFVELVREKAELGLAIAERKEALSLIQKRARTLGESMLYLLTGQFRRFLKSLNLSPHPKHRRLMRNRPKQAASLWLEYWMGWAPMVADVYAAVDVLQSGYPDDLTVKASALSTAPYNGSAGVNHPSYDYWFWYFTAKVKVRYQGTVSVTNPNLYRANQLGLINPVALAWQLIPFSFIVDWFVNVGQVLNSWSDFLGLEIKDTMTSVTKRLYGDEYYRKWGAQTTWSASAGSFSRVLTLDKPKLGWRQYRGLSATRAATAISLLVSIFTKANYAASGASPS